MTPEVCRWSGHHRVKLMSLFVLRCLPHPGREAVAGSAGPEHSDPVALPGMQDTRRDEQFPLAAVIGAPGPPGVSGAPIVKLTHQTERRGIGCPIPINPGPVRLLVQAKPLVSLGPVPE